MERRQVLAFQKDLSEGDLSIRTCNNIMKILKIILNDAVTDEIIIKNPAEGVKALKEVDAKAAETYHRALTEQEQKDFMQEMSDDYYYEFVAFLLCTGMRFGEAAALTWSDIDYRQNVIHVTKTATFNEDNTRTTGTPKSEAGKRDIPLNDTIKGILARQRKKQRIVISIDREENRVFVSVYGKMVDNSIVNKAIRSALARLEGKGKLIEDFTVHALRDTHKPRSRDDIGEEYGMTGRNIARYIFHKHRASHPYHRHGRANTLRQAVRSIRGHDWWQMNGRRW